MSGYRSLQLGELQEKILKHFFDCKSSTEETVSHISKSIGVVHPAVFNSVELLINENYLVKDPQFKHGKKALLITDKGAAAAVVLGISYEDMVSYFMRLSEEYSSAAEQLVYLKKFENIFQVSDRKEFLVRKMMEYFLKTNLYKEGGIAKWPSQNELKLLLAYLSIEYNNAFGNLRTVKDLIDKYGIDKKVLKTMFEKDRNRIDSIIRSLED